MRRRTQDASGRRATRVVSETTATALPHHPSLRRRGEPAARRGAPQTRRARVHQPRRRVHNAFPVAAPRARRFAACRVMARWRAGCSVRPRRTGPGLAVALTVPGGALADRVSWEAASRPVSPPELDCSPRPRVLLPLRGSGARLGGGWVGTQAPLLRLAAPAGGGGTLRPIPSRAGTVHTWPRHSLGVSHRASTSLSWVMAAMHPTGVGMAYARPGSPATVVWELDRTGRQDLQARDQPPPPRAIIGCTVCESCRRYRVQLQVGLTNPTFSPSPRSNATLRAKNLSPARPAGSASAPSCGAHRAAGSR